MANSLLKLKTVGALRESGYKVLSVKEEIRKNLIQKLKNNETIFRGVLGYDDTVIPELYNAILSRHDFILLGLRGQAKSRILRMLPQLLDEYIPIIKGSEINDNPFFPISKDARDSVAEFGDEAEIEWIDREQRYGEKLATPDVTIADLIGDIDPIKAAAKRLHYAHEGVIHFGIIPRVNRGIFAINELPDLQPRIQVGLFNLMQEKDIQIRGFPIRLPIDVLMVYSANPEDYTNRGNIITPLKDRIGSQIMTHYPRDIDAAIKITAQEAHAERDVKVEVAHFVREIVEETAIEARKSEYIDQKSGVSARMTIAFFENAVSNAERRAYLNNEKSTSIRICDLFAALSGVTGKVELVYEGEQEGISNVAKGLLGKAIKNVFTTYFADPLKTMRTKGNIYEKITNYFKGDTVIEISDLIADKEYRDRLETVPGTKHLVKEFRNKEDKGDSIEESVIIEFILEGLHQYSVLSKDELQHKRVYGDMIRRMFDQFENDDDDRSQWV